MFYFNLKLHYAFVNITEILKDYNINFFTFDKKFLMIQKAKL